LGEGKKFVRRGSATNLTLSGRSRARILSAKLMGLPVLSEREPLMSCSRCWSQIIIAGLLAVIVVFSSHPAVAVKRHASIPEPLRGSWAPSAEACKNEDKLVVVLSAKAYTGSEESCSILWVAKPPARAARPIPPAHIAATSWPSGTDTLGITAGFAGQFIAIKERTRCEASCPCTSPRAADPNRTPASVPPMPRSNGSAKK
jgi:hypothetical protein